MARKSLALAGAQRALMELANKLDRYPRTFGKGAKMPITHFTIIDGEKVPCLTSADLRFIASFLD